MRKQFLSIAILSMTLTVSCQTSNSNQPANNGQGATAAANANKPAEKSAETKPNGAIVQVYDGRKEDSESNGKQATAAEKSMVAAEVKKHETAIKGKVKFECNEEGSGDDGAPEIIATASGSFTKAGAQQKMFLYELCRAGRSFGIGGLIVTEGDKAVAHYAYGEDGMEIDAAALSDINKNGVSEILLYGGSTGQGYTDMGISIREIKEGNFDYIGSASVYSDNSGAVEDEAKIKTTAVNISVEPGTTPVFYRENFERKGGKWNAVGKQEKFTLEKGTPAKWVKIM